MNYSTYRFTLNLHLTQSQVSLPVTLGDNARVFFITLSDGGAPYVIGDGCLVKIEIKRPTGTILQEFCPIEKNSTIVYDFSQNEGTAVVPGVHNCTITLYNAKGLILGSPRFTMVVSDRVVTSDDMLNMLADVDFTMFDSMLAKEAERKTNEAQRQEDEQARADVEAQRVLAEEERQANEESRQAQEVTRQAAEADRIANDVVRQEVAESASASAESASASAESASASAESASASAEEARASAESAKASADGVSNALGDYVKKTDADNNYASKKYVDDTCTELEAKALTEISKYAKKTDVASSTSLGVVGINKGYGINIQDTTGKLVILKASTDEISAKSNNYKPIVPSTLDYAIKSGISKNALKLTDTEKEAAQEWLGIKQTNFITLESARGVLNVPTEAKPYAQIKELHGAISIYIAAVDQGYDDFIENKPKRIVTDTGTVLFELSDEALVHLPGFGIEGNYIYFEEGKAYYKQTRKRESYWYEEEEMQPGEEVIETIYDGGSVVKMAEEIVTDVSAYIPFDGIIDVDGAASLSVEMRLSEEDVDGMGQGGLEEYRMGKIKIAFEV